MSKTKLFALMLLIATLALTVHATISIATPQPRQESYQELPPWTGQYYGVKVKTAEEPENWRHTDDLWVIKAIEEYEKYNATRWVEVDQEKSDFYPAEYAGYVDYNGSYYGITIFWIDCFEGLEELRGELVGGGLILGTGWIALGVTIYYKRRSARDL